MIVAMSRSALVENGSFAVANSAQYGTTQVLVADQQWDTNAMTLPAWVAAEKPVKSKQIKITVR